MEVPADFGVASPKSGFSTVRLWPSKPIFLQTSPKATQSHILFGFFLPQSLTNSGKALQFSGKFANGRPLIKSDYIYLSLTKTQFSGSTEYWITGLNYC